MFNTRMVEVLAVIVISTIATGCTKGGFKASAVASTDSSSSSSSSSSPGVPAPAAIPALAPKQISTNEDTTVSIPAATALSTSANFTVLLQPTNGTVSFNLTAQTFTYTPRANFNGKDAFSYGTTAQDQNPQPVSITVVPVNDVPTVSAQTFTAVSGKPMMAALTAFDVEGTALKATVTTQPRFGTLQIAADGTSFSYVSAINMFGSDSFVVTVSDGLANSGTASITVNVSENVDETTISRNLVTTCMSSTLHNACLFWKNPVAQSKAPFAGGAIAPASNLSALQTHAVNIPAQWYDNSGFLKNTSFDVYADTVVNTAARVPTANASFKYAYSDDPDHKLSQVLTFYWLMTQARFMKQRVGTFFAENTNVQVLASDPTVVDNGYYYGGTNQVRLGRAKTLGAANTDFALGAEITIHEMGHANLARGSNQAIYAVDQTANKNKTCGPTTSASVCCVDKNGCSNAINEGQADHHANMLFNLETGLGQHLTNTVSGLSFCGISRDTAANSALTADQAFSACSTSAPTFVGQVHVLGSVYASIWFELRKLAKATSAVEGVDIDRLFSEHLKTLTGTDNFSTAYTKIRAIDTALFAGKFGVRIQAEFTKRNIDIAQ